MEKVEEVFSMFFCVCVFVCTGGTLCTSTSSPTPSPSTSSPPSSSPGWSRPSPCTSTTLMSSRCWSPLLPQLLDFSDSYDSFYSFNTSDSSSSSKCLSSSNLLTPRTLSIPSCVLNHSILQHVQLIHCFGHLLTPLPLPLSFNSFNSSLVLF